MTSIPRQLGLYISGGNSSNVMYNFAFYIAIRGISHEGVIHNYRKILPTLCKRLGVSDSTFRKRVGECKREGFLFEDEAKGLRFVSPKKYIKKEKELHPYIFFSKGKKSKKIDSGSRKFFNSYTKYSDIVLWVRSLTLFNKSSQCNYAERKANLRNGMNNDNSIPSAFQRNSFSLSRKSIASLVNLETKSGAKYFMGRLKDIDISIMDKGRVKLIRPISKYEYNELYLYKRGFFYNNGLLMRRMCNEIQLKTGRYMRE